MTQNYMETQLRNQSGVDVILLFKIKLDKMFVGVFTGAPEIRYKKWEQRESKRHAARIS